MAVIWIKPPSTIAAELARRTAGMEAAISANAASHASRGEAAMKGGAPWNDRTGFARASLFGRAEGTDITLGTANAEYGIYLELGTSRMSPRAIIEPTAREVAPEYFRTSADIVRSMLGGG